jgi:tetratricopeptide (TPR) repeat protein
MIVIFLIFDFTEQVFAGQDSLVISSYIKVAETFKISDPDTALKLADKAYQAALKSGDPVLLALPYQAFANIYYYSGNQQLALDYYFKALKQLEENTHDKELPDYLVTTAKIYCNIGNCYFDLKMVDIALTQYKKSLSLIEETNKQRPGVFTPRNKMLLLHNIGNILASRKEYDQAKQYYLMAQEINESVSDIQVKAGLLESLGVILLKEDQAEEALNYFNHALEVRKEVQDFRGITGTYLFIGDYFLQKKNVLKAKEWYLKAIQLGKKSARWQLVQTAAMSLTQIYLNAADYKNAFEMNNLNAQLNDSIFNTKSETNLTRLALQFEFDRQIKNQEVKQQKEIDSQKSRKTFFIFLSVILLLLSILVVLLLLNQHKKLANAKLRQKQLDLESKNSRLEREKLESELAIKNKELTTNVMYLVQKNEFITDIAQRTKDLIARPPEQAKQSFNNLVADLQRNTDDKIWKEFEVRFQDVHQDFYHRLNEKFPDLTPNEKKLAAFLRLNMSTKDISAITFQSTDSIRIARSRLRKKLDLPSDDNLIGFLESV